MCKNLIIWASATCLLLFILASSEGVSAQKKEVFRLGAIVAQSGPVSIAGVPMKNAMVLAQERLDVEKRLQIIFEDDGFIPRNAVSAAKKLIEQDKVDALVVFGTNQGLAVVDFTEKAGKPLLSINVNRTVVKDRTQSFLFMPSIERLMDVTVQTTRERGINSAAVVATLQDSCLRQRDLFIESGVSKILESIEVLSTDTDFRDSAIRIKNKNPDGVFLSVLPPQGSLYARRLREVGYRGQIFGGIQIAYMAELKASAGGLMDAWVVSGDDRNADKYKEAFRTRFGEEPTAESIFAYDAVGLLIEAVKQGDVSAYLHTVKDYRGVLGSMSADGENGFSIPVIAKEFTHNGFRYITP